MNETIKLNVLSDTEMECYNAILDAKEIAIIALPHKLQGAVGKLKSKGFVEIFREDYTYEYKSKWNGKPLTRMRRTNWVRIKRDKI